MSIAKVTLFIEPRYELGSPDNPFDMTIAEEHQKGIISSADAQLGLKGELIDYTSRTLPDLRYINPRKNDSEFQKFLEGQASQPGWKASTIVYRNIRFTVLVEGELYEEHFEALGKELKEKWGNLRHQPQQADDNDKNEENAEAFSPLIQAAFRGDLEECSQLIQNGADVNATNETGMTPLHAAVSSRHRAIVSLLLDSGADIDAMTKNGITPLLLAKREVSGMEIDPDLINTLERWPQSKKQNVRSTVSSNKARWWQFWKK